MLRISRRDHLDEEQERQVLDHDTNQPIVLVTNQHNISSTPKPFQLYARAPESSFQTHADVNSPPFDLGPLWDTRPIDLDHDTLLVLLVSLYEIRRLRSGPSFLPDVMYRD